MEDKGKGKMVEESYEEERWNSKNLEFQKMGSSSLQQVHHYVQRGMERLDLNTPPVDAGSCMPEKERYIPSKKNILIKKRRTRRYHISSQCLQDGCSTCAVNHQRVEEEFRIVHGRRELTEERKRAWLRQRAPAPQLIPGHMRESFREIGATNYIWVTEKAITPSEISKNLNRLFFPENCTDLIENEITDEERIELFELPAHRLQINLIDQNLRVWEMELRYWPSLNRILLAGYCEKTENSDETGIWYKFVKHFDLVPGMDKVQIWCFRAPALGTRLCFAINILKPPAPEGIPSPKAAPGPSTMN